MKVHNNKKINQLSEVYMSQARNKYEFRNLVVEPVKLVIDDDLQYNLKCIPLMEQNLNLSRYK